MTFAAGIDVGNSTTEVVLARLVPAGSRGAGGPSSPIEIIGTGRAPTRRAKGSPESLAGAAALVRRLERQFDVRIDRAIAARLRPVHTLTATLPEPQARTGRLRVVGASARTAGGDGFAVARPYLLTSDDALDGDDPVVAVVPAGLGFREALGPLQKLLAAGRLRAVVLADDEAVLIANRLGGQVPVIDEIDAATVMPAELVAVEVAAPGRALRTLTDPLRLITALGLAESERADAAGVARRLHDAGNAVVTLGLIEDDDRLPVTGGWVDLAAGGRQPFGDGHRAIIAGRVGLARGYALPPDGTEHRVDDLWSVDLAAVAETVVARAGGPGSRPVALAALLSDTPLSDPSAALAGLLGVPVSIGLEARAGWLGGCSTPGSAPGSTPGSDRAVVVDLGAGTIDAVSATGTVVAAGGGELLTAAVAMLTGTTSAAAEWVKRGAADRVEAPQVLLGEDGSRRFLDRPATADSIGRLVVPGPAGLLPFSSALAPGEWRALRLRLKVEALGGNVIRALRTLDADPRTVIVVGGPAGDDEVLAAVTRALPDGVAIGRGEVAGRLGHRYAVAYGLLALLATEH